MECSLLQAVGGIESSSIMSDQTNASHDEVPECLSGCDFVRFTCSDIHGIHRGRSVPAKYVKQAIQQGVSLHAGKWEENNPLIVNSCCHHDHCYILIL